LFQSWWNLSRQPTRRPRILFLADRNILANQAYNDFSAFPEDAMVRIEPESIRKKGKVPKNGSLFFTIFQTFMSGPPKDGHPVIGRPLSARPKRPTPPTGGHHMSRNRELKPDTQGQIADQWIDVSTYGALLCADFLKSRQCRPLLSRLPLVIKRRNDTKK
jgi:hypothetical protein